MKILLFDHSAKYVIHIQELGPTCKISHIEIDQCVEERLVGFVCGVYVTSKVVWLHSQVNNLITLI